MDAPPLLTASEIADELRLAALSKKRFLLDAPIDGEPPRPFTMTTASLWRIMLWIEPSGPRYVMAAIDPDRRTWHYGCERQWQADGSVIEPLAMLPPSTRQLLNQRLRDAATWPDSAAEARAAMAANAPHIRELSVCWEDPS